MTEILSSKGILKIDLHTHILPHHLPELKDKYGYGGFVSLQQHTDCKAKMFIDGKFFREIEDNCYSPEKRIKECNKTGVNVQVLSTIPVMFSYWAKPEHTLDLARYLNDDIAQTVSMYPKRFVGLGTLPMQAPDLAVKELRRCVQDLGLSGVQIGSHINDWNLDREELFPFFEEAERLKASIFIHPWDMMGQQKMEKYWLPWLVGMPAETNLAICSMIFGGVFEKFPDLKVAFAHGGGSFPGTIGRIERGWKCRPDLCQIDCKTNPRKFCGKFWVDSLVHDTVALHNIINLFGDDKIILGSDYPFPLGEYGDIVPGTTVEESKLSYEQKEKIYCTNALQFLGLEKDRFIGDDDDEEEQDDEEETDKEEKVSKKD